MMVKSGLEFSYFEFSLAPSEIPANLPAFLGRLGQWNFKIENSRPLFTIVFNSKMLVSRPEILVH